MPGTFLISGTALRTIDWTPKGWRTNLSHHEPWYDSYRYEYCTAVQFRLGTCSVCDHLCSASFRHMRRLFTAFLETFFHPQLHKNMCFKDLARANHFTSTTHPPHFQEIRVSYATPSGADPSSSAGDVNSRAYALSPIQVRRIFSALLLVSPPKEYCVSRTPVDSVTCLAEYVETVLRH